MFTWICPQCGREVPPSYSECPDCAAREKGEPAAPVEEPAAPAPTPPPPPKRAARAPRRSMPTWLMSLLFAAGFIAIGVGAYWGVSRMGRNAEKQHPALAFEDPGTAQPKPHPLEPYIEVTGVRFLQDDQKRTEVRFVLVNHSPDSIRDLAGTVTLLGRAEGSGEQPVGTFGFKVPSLAAWGTREMSAVMDTALRVYELPDWQNVSTRVRITAP